jgi:protein-S-isoprenylcysteine O-methyltransferase Ste14
MSGTEPGPRAWPGRRGESYVALQFLLIALILTGPATVSSCPAWPSRLAPWLWAVGAGLLGGGALLGALAFGHLRSNLTALPEPRPGGYLVRTGPYRWVRHPIYGGLLAGSVGYACLWRGWLTLAYVALLFVLLDRKVRFEERRLTAAYPGYEEYCRRTKRLIPYIY